MSGDNLMEERVKVIEQDPEKNNRLLFPFRSLFFYLLFNLSSVIYIPLREGEMDMIPAVIFAIIVYVWSRKLIQEVLTVEIQDVEVWVPHESKPLDAETQDELLKGMKLYLFLVGFLSILLAAVYKEEPLHLVVASIHLSNALLLVLYPWGWRRRGRQWLRNMVPQATSYQEISTLRDLETIQEAGLYFLSKQPLCLIRITQENDLYEAAVRLETDAEWQPMLNQKQRPQRLRKIRQVVRALRRYLPEDAMMPA